MGFKGNFDLNWDTFFTRWLHLKGSFYTREGYDFHYPLAYIICQKILNMFDNKINFFFALSI